MYTFTWIYTKYSEKLMTEMMAAEIEYVKITGMEYNPKQCLKCKQGWSQIGSDRCSLCGAKSYIELSPDKVQLCKPCPPGYTSAPSSIGLGSCEKMRPCNKSDILTKYGQCEINSQMRNVTYAWIHPIQCNQDDTTSVALPKPTSVPCRKCGRGQYFNRGIG